MKFIDKIIFILNVSLLFLIFTITTRSEAFSKDDFEVIEILSNDIDDGKASISSSSLEEYRHFFWPKKHRKQRKHSSTNELKVETRSLDEIYRAALAEGNSTLIVYSGGITKGSMDSFGKAFEARFPGISVDIVVDYSVYHGPRIDAQLSNGSLVPDVVHLQTLQDFPRWKEQGVLMKYKPINWDKVYKKFRDPDGFFTGTWLFFLGTIVNAQKLSNNSIGLPTVALDLLKSELKGKITVVHPTQDDAVLFYFKQLVDKYGLSFLEKFSKQNSTYRCVGDTSIGALNNGTSPFAVSPSSVPFGNSNTYELVFPENNDPFTTYAMYTAIFKQTKRPEASKLYMSWMLQNDSPTVANNTWTVRTDIPPLAGYKPIWDYTNSNHQKFAAFMANYEERERFSKQTILYFGESPCGFAPLEESLYPS